MHVFSTTTGITPSLDLWRKECIPQILPIPSFVLYFTGAPFCKETHSTIIGIVIIISLKYDTG